MAYADYTYYTEAYGGATPEADFMRLSRQASAYIDSVTFDRIKSATLSDDEMIRVKDACCAVVDTYLFNERGGTIAAETNDGISVTYATGVSTAKTDNQRLREAVSLYLGSTGLLYRGAY